MKILFTVYISTYANALKKTAESCLINHRVKNLLSNLANQQNTQGELCWTKYFFLKHNSCKIQLNKSLE